AVAPDGATVATAGRDGIIHLWAGGSGRHLARLEADRNRRPQVLYSSDGQRLIWWGAYAWSKTLRVWDPKTGQPVRRFDLEGPDVLWAAVSDDGKTAVSVDWKNKLDRFHDLTTGKVTREVPDDFHRPIALSPSGDRLVGLDGTLMTVAGRKELVNIPRVYASSASVRFAADGRRLIAAAIAERSYKKYLSEPPAEEVAVVDTVEGKELRRFGLETDFRAIHAVALSRDGKTAVTVRGSGQKPNEQVVTLWETETGRERGYFRGHIGKVNGLAISPDGRFIMSASDDTTALVWDATRPRTRDGFVRRESGPADLPDRFKDLAGENAERAYASIWTLVNAPKDAVPFLADQGELFATTDVKKIRQWIQNLDHDRYADRERATQELGLVLDEAESNLREELRTNRSEEARRRIELLLQARSTGVTGRELQRLRVIEVLEHVAAEGGEATRRAAVAVLKRLGDMPGRPTHEAKATLERLGRGAELKP
ncbi:MAG TPA: hypothetical protein VKD90_24035, partial [Gemmataceae bacterium]|nr:hypothetical protein [Gemmataceae bacterium]